MDELLNANVSFIKKEYAAAVAGYQKLMRENQDPIAACNLGFLYQQGLGVERDYEKAIQCYHASCYEDGGSLLDPVTTTLTFSVQLGRNSRIR